MALVLELETEVVIPCHREEGSNVMQSDVSQDLPGHEKGIKVVERVVVLRNVVEDV